MARFLATKNRSAEDGEPDILLKLSKDREARVLSSSSPFSRIPFNWEMMDKKAGRCNPALNSIDSEELNHVTVIRHALTKSKCLESKHLDMFFKNGLSPSPINDSNNFFSNSSPLFSSPSYDFNQLISQDTFSIQCKLQKIHLCTIGRQVFYFLQSHAKRLIVSSIHKKTLFFIQRKTLRDDKVPNKENLPMKWLHITVDPLLHGQEV